MGSFDPPTLEARLRAAVEKLANSGVDLLLHGKDLSDAFDAAGETIAEDTELELVLPRVDELMPMAVAEALAVIEETTNDDTTFDGLTYHSSSRTLLRLSAGDPRTHVFIDSLDTTEGKLALGTFATIGPHTIGLGITRMSQYFGLAVSLGDFHHDKYFPPLTHDECFIELRHPPGVTAEAALGVANAYLFELHATLQLILFEAPRPSPAEVEYPEDREAKRLAESSPALRPLLVGPGLSALLQEFRRGIGVSDPETSILHHVKCIEYVSATVVRERQYEDLRKRLLSSEGLNPTASYMDGLMALVEENRQFTKDYEALKLTVERCCDPVTLARHAPLCLGALHGILPTSKLIERRQALHELATCLSATRNQAAHAKANYERTSKECPPDQLDPLATCAKIAAEQCIRWYAAQNPELRRA